MRESDLPDWRERSVPLARLFYVEGGETIGHAGDCLMI
ncbi:hypothetical protein C362_05492 [Cryptococcus neoformans Bt1]|nr:hypothetical protein C362_05492 [Cryptococcus neoformans var. grubii Bt1]